MESPARAAACLAWSILGIKRKSSSGAIYSVIHRRCRPNGLSAAGKTAELANAPSGVAFGREHDMRGRHGLGPAPAHASILAVRRLALSRAQPQGDDVRLRRR